ncbi:MAG: efflux RND transporter periplasmic adaptor subunit [Gracilimonas sp.]|nr:efflux RND transporter periplasmic adaptor subunit [Gracilimonas sp.]
MEKLNLILLTVIIAVFTACSAENIESESDQPVGKTVNVETETLTMSTFRSHLRVVGNVETKNDIMISAEVGGRLIEQTVAEGEQVQKGETILRIDDSKLKQEKARLEAVTAQARENYERLKRIYEEDGIGSEIDYLNAKYNFEQSKSALESIKVDLENATISAPFTGTVEAYILEEGEMASPGMQVVRLIGTNTFIVSAGVPARYADVIQNGDEVDIWFDTQTADTLKGTISFVGNSIDPQSRTFRIEVLLPADSKKYKVDMIANLRLYTLRKENVIIVSEEFIYKDEDEFITYVKTVNEEGYPVAQRRVVELGASFRSDVIITNGLSSGDELITIGSAFLNDGVRLNIVDDRATDLASQ